MLIGMTSAIVIKNLKKRAALDETLFWNRD
jgi:hypothetical protein